MGVSEKKTQKNFFLQKWLIFKTFFYLSFDLKDLFWAAQNVHKISIKTPGGIGVARGEAQGARPPPNQNSTNDKKLWQHSLTMFSCSFFSVIAHITVIKQ